MIAALVLSSASLRASAAEQTLELEVVVNGYDTGKIGEFVQRGTALLARPEELADLGIKVPPSQHVGPDKLVPLSDLSGVSWAIDQSTQTMRITASADRLLPELLHVAGPAGQSVPVESGLGVTLNYDVTGTYLGSQSVGSGLFNLQAFSPWGVASSGLLTEAGEAVGGNGNYSATRLDSTYTFSDPDSMRQYRLGDFITGGLNWTRPVRLGGAQIDIDFGTRPDLVTFPLPSVGGSVAVPSTVNVLVNGAQLLTREISPGPFQIPQLPVVTGAGSVSMTVTNALGRQVTTTQPFYASSTLLKPGLESYSAEIGAVRLNWGLISDDYGNLAGSLTYRRGLSRDLTIEAHAEGTAGDAMAGGGLAVNLFNFGVASLDVAGSDATGQSGHLISFGAQRIGRVFSVSASATIANRNFRDIAAMNGDPMPRQQINASAGLSLGRFGSFGIAYTAVDLDEAPAPVSFVEAPGSVFTQSGQVPGGTVSSANGIVTFQPALHSQILSASYSLQIGQVSLYATGFHDFAANNSTGVLFGITVPLGPRSSVSASVNAGAGAPSEQVQAVQTPVTIGDWGYQVYGATGNPSHEFAQVQYESPWALVSVGADRLGQQTSLRTEAQGAVSIADGGVFPSNTINDSFAVVDTNGAKDVHVLYENRDVGETDSDGQLLVPYLRSFDVNHLAIVPTDIPVDATVPTTTQEVRPQDRSGVVVRFPVTISHGALVRLVDEAGRPVPVGSTATLQATGVQVPVGYDGEAYVENLGRHNIVRVEKPDGARCDGAFDYRARPGEIPQIGPVPCKEATP
jgi:outer membrane usher protein